MINLTPDECRALGVLVEKAMTTPAQYPLSLNAILNGCNQKNNRHPIVTLSEDHVFEAMEGLRQKGFAREVALSGSRVSKYRHVMKEALEIDTNEMVILTELLLRGPQTVGELRSRASRMHALESTDVVQQALRFLMDRDEPLIQELPPIPGTRARRYAQLLCPDLHPLGAPSVSSAAAAGGPVAAPAPSSDDSALAGRVEALEREVAQLREVVSRLAQELGADDVMRT